VTGAPAVYAAAVDAYLAAGWTCVIPVPPEAKFPPPAGFTGASGRDTGPADVARWVMATPGASIALRLPDGVIGIDVDEYAKGEAVKHGAATLAAKVADWGELPPTYSSTARGPGQPSRIMLYRVPAGVRFASVLGPDVEIIQRHHRYAVVAPSPHHGAGAPYAWYGPDGVALEHKIPRPEDLAELPPAWVTGLAEGASAAGPASAGREAAEALLAVIADQAGESATTCVSMDRARLAAIGACTGAERGSRHDAMTEHTYEVIMLAAEGHPGCTAVLGELAGLWNSLTAGEGREHEFWEMLTTAAGKAVTKLGGRAEPAGWDPCLMMNAVPYAAPTPDAGDGMAPDPVEPARVWSPFEVIGTEVFDPGADMDGLLARAVLHRTRPLIRYAADAGTWIARGPIHWEARSGDLGKWAVDLLSWLMRPGDPAADKGTPAETDARRRARFTTNASANAIAGKISAQVAAGYHPSTVELGELDGEHEILWAGGQPYDIRLSAAHPELSRVLDLGTPHLHSAGVVPETRETPLWDAFVAAVWPQPGLRAWALRVLSVAFTGYSDKALPILLGESNTGKTQLLVLLMSVLGSYAHVADARLLAPADRSHASIVYALKGRRLSFIDEAPRTGQLATERLKQITGGAELTGNQMGKNPITFMPTHTLILTANPEHEPVLTDAAIRSRVRLIPCDGNQAEVAAARAAIGALSGPAWRREAPGVLAKMLSEAAQWLEQPQTASNAEAPAEAAMAAEEVRASQDHVLGWLAEECESSERGTKGRELYVAFTESCRRMNVHPSAIPSETRWGRRLTELGYPSRHTNQGNIRQLRIRPPVPFTPGSYSPAAPHGAAVVLQPGPGEGLRPESEGLVHGSEASSQPFTEGETAGQTIHPTIHGEGLNSTQPYITHARTHTRTHMNGGANDPSPPSTVHLTPPQPETPLMPEAPEAGAASPPERDEPEPAQPAKKARKAPAKKPERVRPAPELEGPVHPLPVIVARNPAGGAPIVAPCTVAEAAQLAGGYLDALCVDVEHSGFPIAHADYRLRLVQLGGEHVAAVFDPSDAAQAAAIADLLGRARKLHAHSAAADLVPLAHAGLGDADEMWAKMEDSVLVTKLGDPSLAGSDENELKRLAAGLLGDYAVSPAAEKAKNELFKDGRWLIETKAMTPREKSGWAMVKPGCETFARYAGSDVLDLAAVIRTLPRPDEAILERERTFQAMCARVAHTGFRLRPDHIRAKIAEFAGLRDAAQRRVHELCPDIINPSSSREVPAALAAMGVPLGLTREGNPSASKENLELLAKQKDYPHAELLAQILQYRHCVTTLGLLLEPLNVLCERGDGRMRPVVYTINADTGRTSCVRPNGQQFSRQGGIRACVGADPGMIGISADFSGVEIRVGAALSGDMDLLAAELSTRCQACGQDPCDMTACGKNQKGLHWMAARMAFGPDATKEGRYNSKRIIFCVPEDGTEILTRRGWLAHDQVRAGDETLGRNPGTGLLEWTPVTGVQHFGEAELVRIANKDSGWEAVVTPGHRWATSKRRDGGSRGRYFAEGMTETQDLSCEHSLILGALAATPEQLPITPAEAALIAWAYTDGHVFQSPLTGRTSQGRDGRRRKLQVSIAQAKPAGVHALEKVLADCGADFARDDKPLDGKDKRTMPSSVWRLRTEYARELWGRAGLLAVAGKNLPGFALEQFVLRLGTEQRGAFFQACMDAEGYRDSRTGAPRISQNAGPVLDAIKLAATLEGYYVREHVTRFALGTAPHSVLVLSRPRVGGTRLRKEPAGSAPVWCVTTGHGTWLMRQNGRIMLTGNSKMFGGGPKSGAAQVGLPLAAGIAVHNAFEQIAPGFAEWDRQMRAYLEAGNRGFTAYSGRTIWLPRGRSHAAGNYAIQGTAREILVDGVLKWGQTRWGAYPLLPIHDEVLTFVPVAEAAEALETLKACMANELYGVPIVAAADEPFEFWPDSS